MLWRKDRLIGAGRRRHAPVGKLELEPCAGADIGRGVQGMAGFIAHQGKAAGQHAAIGQGGK